MSREAFRDYSTVPPKGRLDLSECERRALRAALSEGVPAPHRMPLMSMLERSAPVNPRVRYVVYCESRRRSTWTKVLYTRESAQAYAQHAREMWCRREGVRIARQRWIAF